MSSLMRTTSVWQSWEEQVRSMLDEMYEVNAIRFAVVLLLPGPRASDTAAMQVVVGQRPFGVVCGAAHI